MAQAWRVRRHECVATRADRARGRTYSRPGALPGTSSARRGWGGSRGPRRRGRGGAERARSVTVTASLSPSSTAVSSRLYSVLAVERWRTFSSRCRAAIETRRFCCLMFGIPRKGPVGPGGIVAARCALAARLCSLGERGRPAAGAGQAEETACLVDCRLRGDHGSLARTRALSGDRGRRAFGVEGEINAFTVAFQVRTLCALSADAALGAAFVPVFSELLERSNVSVPGGSPPRSSGSSS